MKITNILLFTENHRFYVYRDFSLSSMDYKMLSSIYQSMIGAYAISVYTWLYQQIPAEKAGYSDLEQQRKLFLALDLEPSERGRKHLIEQTSKLEAVGLMQTSRKYIPNRDEYVYEYQLTQPLSPNEFFKNQHLTILLRDKIGKYLVLSYWEELQAEEPEELAHQQINSENVSVPFYELFQLNTTIDYELEQALSEMAPARQTENPPVHKEKGFDYAEIIMRFPRESYNRAFVENMRFDHEQLAALNYVAGKYKLSLQETCRLLDEDDVFSEDGQLHLDALQQKANLHFRQGKKRDEERERHLHQTTGADVPPDIENVEEKAVEMEYYLEVPAMFHGKCDIHQYNMLLRNEPYTRVLKRFFPGAVPGGLLDVFQKIDLNYKLKEEVINVLIHYLHLLNKSWTNAYIEAIAQDMLGKQIATYEQAVRYIREAAKAKSKPAGKYAGSTAAERGRSKQKPKIPIVSETRRNIPITEDELDKIRKKALKLDGKM